MHTRVCTQALLPIMLVVSMAACTSQPRSGKTPLILFAASSLTETFRDLERGFEMAHPDIDVQLTFSGSQVLRLQIEQGAAADVFASANEAHMSALAEGGLIERPRAFAENTLAVIVPLDNPARIEQIADLARARRLVIGTGHVPIGAYTRQMLARLQARSGDALATTIRSKIVSEEANARLVRAKVELGEADAAVVYRTDAVASDRLRAIPIPEALNVRARYLVGALRRSPRAREAAAFIEFALSPKGQALLEGRGFLPVPP